MKTIFVSESKITNKLSQSSNEKKTLNFENDEKVKQMDLDLKNLKKIQYLKKKDFYDVKISNGIDTQPMSESN